MIFLIVQQLRSNKISLNADKTEIILVRSMGKQINKYLNFWISCQKSNISNKPKYVGLQIEQNLE